MVLLPGLALPQYLVHLGLLGLGVVGAELSADLDVTLRLPDLVVQLGVVQGKADVSPELINQSLVLLSDWSEKCR